MNRIDSMFAELKKQNKKALITFITAGDPDFDTTEQLVLKWNVKELILLN